MVREHSSLAQFRERLRQSRLDRGWSQADLAKHLADKGFGHIYPTTIAKIENRERTVRIDEAAAIADVLGTSVDALMGRTIDDDAELTYALRGLTSAAKRSAEQVQDIVRAIGQARDDIGAGDFSGRDLLQADVKRALQRLEAAQGALATVGQFERGMKPAPTPGEIGK
ncbi:helix-turn-helix transcriptional regulator [Mycobacterium manitobense]|uniref:Helix-turn-helix transcriptional regulator n=1 Tax=[Mycobacterium] manitobense TaxID=190147 RepID=A0A9X2YEA7_9MYCO|nr:helix-turn-helix transcriptional regulator [[Mycobacterium] manitobense]MCV7173078.1 helix-turn-helix transcriptional regulator [[Mycobacterium] manitobense]